MKPDPDRSIETLIRLAGEREMPSEAGMARARLAAGESWRRMLEASAPRPRWHLPVAWAAALGLVAITAGFWLLRDDTPPGTVVARVVATSGASSLSRGDAQIALARDTDVISGSTLATGRGRVATSISAALSLRLDANTRVSFDSHDHVTLLQGALYVDSGGLGTGPPLTISTPAGDVRHIGTQFQVRVSGETTRIRVREGRVSLRRGSGDTRMVAVGDELEVQGDEERWRRGLASFGDQWEWAATVASTLAIEDRPLAEFLAWIAREHGWRVHYSDEALQQRTLDIHLHGSIDGLATDAMLERVSLVTGIPLQANDGVLWVGAR
jgi:ferric-dicitrate binding protein FerR (iron transport regulator)